MPRNRSGPFKRTNLGCKRHFEELYFVDKYLISKGQKWIGGSRMKASEILSVTLIAIIISILSGITLFGFFGWLQEFS
ncbi:hypothetical protein AKJ43_01000 [candidate division MSBL1 archaeon SCGC-AAA261D19]|uniref:Uncharacterized protein n=1 Tax=candidate division MSBL1 archaeon SCGC-AAA261D19 TaxID=1698273 RepID=A0A133V883_9EURY|nr:hypothetical protein AKJ43_01000 [candidate division MSBL1 archaeon SCGC-AAA261D19]